MISPCPPYYSSALSCLLRSHHVLLFRLVASDCLSCSAKLGRSVLSSSLALSFSMPLASCLLLSCYSARILSALLCHEAASIWYWEVRLRLSHQGTQTNLCVPCVCRGAEARILFLVCVQACARELFSYCPFRETPHLRKHEFQVNGSEKTKEERRLREWSFSWLARKLML